LHSQQEKLPEQLLSLVVWIVASGLLVFLAAAFDGVVGIFTGFLVPVPMFGKPMIPRQRPFNLLAFQQLTISPSAWLM